MEQLRVYKLGIVPYKKALQLQLSLHEKRKHGEITDTLLLLEHPPTVTSGRRGKPEHLLDGYDNLVRKGIHFEIIGRGGDITYHGPGQLVGYPILDLNNYKKDIHSYLRKLEEITIGTLKDFNMKGERKKRYTGVWVEGEKIASIGVGVKSWITYHGFALNVNTDLSYFDMIIPCGIKNVKITSMKKLLGNQWNIKMFEVENSIVEAFSKVFKIRLTNDVYDKPTLFKEVMDHKI